MQLWKGIAAAGYGNGQVRLYETSTGALHVQINAHARAICALDLAPETGKVSLLHPYTPGSWWGDAERNSTGSSLPLGEALQTGPVRQPSDSHSSSLPFLNSYFLQPRTPLYTSGS